MARFTKQHYEMIAAVLADVRPEDAHDLRSPKPAQCARCQWETVRDALADLFASDNGRFDRDRFRDAANSWDRMKVVAVGNRYGS